MVEIQIITKHRSELQDITEHVRNFIRNNNIQHGICTIFCPHTTAGVTINENADPDVKADILRKLGEIIPAHDNYRHIEGNSDAHIKASLIGNSTQVIVENGRLILGTWQGIYFCEFDGPRNRKVWITV